MTELINTLKTFASSTGINSDRKSSSGQLRIIPLLNIGVGKSETEADPGFIQWRDAMRMVARLPGGLPTEFRLKLWENLSEKYLADKGITWARVMTASSTATSRDTEIADQIHKDLHRTGCVGFSGAKQEKLKSVLTAYGRWNPTVGYCQGFNIIGSMVLEMTQGDETLTLKVLIFLVEGIMPQGYFSGGLRGLAVDMAVFRELLRMRKPTLHAQLCRLQGGEEQPPLIDVFTMHWFLTAFIHCLPTSSVLRIWDLLFLEGSEVLLRAALVLWAAIEKRILDVKTADEFYSVMGAVTREMLESGLMDANSLVKCIVSVGPFPFPGLDDLRSKHRTLIAKETPYKSFFLAKRELDNLKKHYTAIRHRQKATTIILKGFEVSRLRVSGQQRSNSLFIPTTKKQLVSPKPKTRRGSSGTPSSAKILSNRNDNSRAIAPQNLNANASRRVIHHGTPRTKQVTVAWEKRLRRRHSPSSSSSSTELCDSDDVDSSTSSEGVWSDTDNRCRISLEKQLRTGSSAKENETPLADEVSSQLGESKCSPRDIPKIDIDTPVYNNQQFTLSFNDVDEICETKGQKDVSISRSSSIIDTNDSQHFLEEMTKLGKSDSFYESMSKRICELQFQNLKTLSQCQTIIDPKALTLPPFPKSPLGSPLPSPLPGEKPVKGSSTHEISPKSPILLLSTECNQSQSQSAKTLPLEMAKIGAEPSKIISPMSPLAISATQFSLFPRDEITNDMNFTPENLGFSEMSPVHTLTTPTSPQLNTKGVTLAERSRNKSGNSNGADISGQLVVNESFPKLGLQKEDSTFDEDASPSFPTISFFGQFTETRDRTSDLQSEEEDKINAVIRENMAILQRLKLNKTTSYLGDQSGDDEGSYEEVGDEDDEGERRSEDDRDSGAPSSSRASITKERICSVSSTASTDSRTSSSSRKRTNRKSGQRPAEVTTGRRSSSTTSDVLHGFNPFPTVRRARLRVTKYGLYK